MRDSVCGLKNERGATMVEQAMVFPLFVLITFGILELCYLSYHSLSLQFAVSRAMRTVSIDRNANAAQTRLAIANAFHSAGVTLLASDKVTLCPVGTNGAQCTEDSIHIGDFRELMLLRIRRPAQSLFAGFVPSIIDITAEAVGRNEPS